MGINEYDELRGENIALRREAEELRAQLEIAHGALDEAERANAAAAGRAAGYREAAQEVADYIDECPREWTDRNRIDGVTALVTRLLAPAATVEGTTHSQIDPEKLIKCWDCGGSGSHYTDNGRDGWQCDTCKGTGLTTTEKP